MAKPSEPSVDPAAETIRIGRERVVERECAGCGAALTITGKGRPPTYCSGACRQRAWALRTAQRRLDTGADPRPRVVREVVERERIIVRRAPVTSYAVPINSAAATAPTAPATVRTWTELLAELEQQLATDGHPTATNHWQHRRLYDGLVHAMTALGKAHPGGLEQLRRRRDR